MPIYEYRCDKCSKTFKVAISLALTNELSEGHICSTCGSFAGRVFPVANKTKESNGKGTNNE